jgi:hypothetical protein
VASGDSSDSNMHKDAAIAAIVIAIAAVLVAVLILAVVYNRRETKSEVTYINRDRDGDRYARTGPGLGDGTVSTARPTPAIAFRAESPASPAASHARPASLRASSGTVSSNDSARDHVTPFAVAPPPGQGRRDQFSDSPGAEDSTDAGTDLSSESPYQTLRGPFQHSLQHGRASDTLALDDPDAPDQGDYISPGPRSASNPRRTAPLADYASSSAI